MGGTEVVVMISMIGAIIIFEIGFGCGQKVEHRSNGPLRAAIGLIDDTLRLSANPQQAVIHIRRIVASISKEDS